MGNPLSISLCILWNRCTDEKVLFHKIRLLRLTSCSVATSLKKSLCSYSSQVVLILSISHVIIPSSNTMFFTSTNIDVVKDFCRKVDLHDCI